MTREALVYMLEAMRSQIDAALALLAAGAGPAPCPHPPEARRNLTVMGGPDRWQCRACGYEHTEGA